MRSFSAFFNRTNPFAKILIRDESRYRLAEASTSNLTSDCDRISYPSVRALEILNLLLMLRRSQFALAEISARVQIKQNKRNAENWPQQCPH